MKVRARSFLAASDRRVARHMLWLGAITSVQFLGTLIQAVLSARILGPEGFGVLSLFTAVTIFIFYFMAMPGAETITTYVTRSVVAGQPEEAAGILRFVLGVTLGLALLSYGLLVGLTLLTDGFLGVEARHEPAWRIYGLVGFFMVSRLESLALLRLANRLPWGLAATAVGTLVLMAMLALAWWRQGGLPMVVWALVTGTGVTSAGLFLAAVISAPRAGVPGLLRSWSVRVPRDMVRFQTASYLNAKVHTLGVHADMLLLGALTSPVQVGLYRAALQVINATTLPIQPIIQGVQAEYSRRWYTADSRGLRRTVYRFTLLSAGLGAVIYGLLALGHQPLVRLGFGTDFAAVARPLLILIPGALVWMCLSALRVLPLATGRALPSLVWTSVALAVMIGVLLLLGPPYRVEDAAWARTSYYLVIAAIAIPAVVLRLTQRNPESPVSARPPDGGASGFPRAGPRP